MMALFHTNRTHSTEMFKQNTQFALESVQLKGELVLIPPNIVCSSASLCEGEMGLLSCSYCIYIPCNHMMFNYTSHSPALKTGRVIVEDAYII